MLTFEWDAAKARRNLAKHGVSFDDATRVFDDPFALMLQDRVEGGEERGRRSAARALTSPSWSRTSLATLRVRHHSHHFCTPHAAAREETL